MKAAPFDYLRVDSASAAVNALVDSAGDGKIIAGGQSLMPVLVMRLARPSILIDINHIPGLSSIRSDDDSVHLGALVRHHQLVDQRGLPLLAEAGSWIGHTAIRSRGTTGGSIAHADPSAELPVVASVLDATVTVLGPNGQRTLSANELFVGALETSLEDEEIITGLTLPRVDRWGFSELARRHGDFGIITVVVAHARGTWRIGIGGVAGVPFRPVESEAILNGAPLTTQTIREAGRAAAAAIQTSTDIHASAAYRSAMAEEFTVRAITQARSTAHAGVHA